MRTYLFPTRVSSSKIQRMTQHQCFFLLALHRSSKFHILDPIIHQTPKSFQLTWFRDNIYTTLQLLSSFCDWKASNHTRKHHLKAVPAVTIKCHTKVFTRIAHNATQLWDCLHPIFWDLFKSTHRKQKRCNHCDKHAVSTTGNALCLTIGGEG